MDDERGTPGGWAKDYRLNGYPTLPNGKFAEYGHEDYVAWLADYLHETVAESNPEQDALLAYLLRVDSRVAMAVIGGHAGSDTLECETRPYYCYPDGFDLESDLSALKPLDPEEAAMNLEELDPDPRCHLDFVKEDYAFHLRYRDEMKLFRKHWPQFQKRWDLAEESQGTLPEPADAGWRILLAAILRPVSDKGRRMELLQVFFDEYMNEVTR